MAGVFGGEFATPPIVEPDWEAILWQVAERMGWTWGELGEMTFVQLAATLRQMSEHPARYVTLVEGRAR